MTIITCQIEMMCRDCSYSVYVFSIQKKSEKGRADLGSLRGQRDVPTTCGPQARTVSKAAAVEQCYEVSPYYLTGLDKELFTSRTHLRCGNFS